jgi:hypothetical protein
MDRSIDRELYRAFADQLHFSVLVVVRRVWRSAWR